MNTFTIVRFICGETSTAITSPRLFFFFYVPAPPPLIHLFFTPPTARSCIYTRGLVSFAFLHQCTLYSFINQKTFRNVVFHAVESTTTGSFIFFLFTFFRAVLCIFSGRVMYDRSSRTKLSQSYVSIHSVVGRVWTIGSQTSVDSKV